MNHQQLIERIARRQADGGFVTADRYASTVVDCVGPGVCKQYLGNGFDGKAAIKAARQKLCYVGGALSVEGVKLATSVDDIRKELGDAGELPPHSLMLIKHVLTTPREDRDEDILETKGAIVDPKMPLLWQHIATLPIGKLFKVLKQDENVLRMATVLLDLNELTADAAKLVEADALRFSHGFRALKYVEHKGKGYAGADGEEVKSFRVLSFEIMEESLVSVPSNVDAEIELFSRGALKSEAFRLHAKAMDRMRKKSYAGVDLQKSIDGKVTIKAASFAELQSAVDAGLLGTKEAEETPAPTVAHRDACDCGGQCNDCQEHGSKETMSDGEDLFDNEIDAQLRADTIGCVGCHQVGDKWRPCADPADYERMLGDVGSLPEPSGSASAGPETKSYKAGDTVKVAADGGGMKEGTIALVNPGPVYDVTITGGETIRRLLESELELVQGADNGANGEQNTHAQSTIRKLFEGGMLVKSPEADIAVVRSVPRVAKMFDPATERLEPSSTEIDWAARFIGCGVKDMSILQTACGGLMRGGFMQALDKQLAGATINETRNMSGSTEEPPNFEAVQINSKSRQTFLVEGFRFMTLGGWKFAVRTYYNGWSNSQHYAVYTADHDKGQTLIDNAWQELENNNPLKGDSFSLGGKFLPRNGLDFDSIFLEEKNEDALRTTVKIINKRGKAAANRGVILQGPPGTGKTLGARVIMNQADATYIWIAAKDFWNFGSYGAITYAFDLARKLAPAIMLYEDVDNYITDHTADLLKGEMDGLATSSGVTTLLTTNFPEKLPSALIDRPGRFHDVLEFHLPTRAVRVQMLSKWADDASEGAIATIAASTEGMSGAHIFELAHFAKQLRDEKEIAIDEALTLALAKVEEQRELISAGQLAGSSYRPSRRGAGKSWPTDVVAELSQFAKQIVEDDPLPDSQWRRIIETKMAEQLGIETKAGRSLSAANKAKIQGVHDALEDMEGMDLSPRAAKTIAKAARGTCKELLDSTEQPDDDAPEKITGTIELKAQTPAEALAVILGTGDEETLKKAKAALEASLAVAKSDRRVAELRRFREEKAKGKHSRR